MHTKNLEQIINNLCLIETVTPDYVLALRKGISNDEAEKLASRAVTQAINLLEEIRGE